MNPILKALFLIFPNFFCNISRLADRRGQNPPHGSNSCHDTQKKGQKKAAQQKKISPCPQHKSCRVVEPHRTVSPQEGKQKQGDDGHQPEAQVQYESQDPPPDPAADRPHQVIHQAQKGAQQDPLPHQRPLSQHICRHDQRSSRAKKPPLPMA